MPLCHILPQTTTDNHRLPKTATDSHGLSKVAKSWLIVATSSQNMEKAAKISISCKSLP